MAIIKCKMCGGDLEVTPGLTVAECEFCGTKQTLPKANEEVIQNLFNRANALRLKCEFDKAEQIYEKILNQNNAEAEAHWGIVLCKYGIEYVEDPTTFKRIPTCHRTSYDAVTTDADYLAAVEYADAVQRGIYETEAKAIDAIQKNILSIVKDEKPFDVFICYKETDENGKRTIDSSIANDIYHQLTQEGLKVFYAAITLEDKLGQEYEPYIFAALNSAKVMLVIGTKPQYFTTVWVKNEWSRFLKLMKTDRSKLLIPCYRDMDAYELPEEFAHLQAQDMSKIGFINDVVRGIRKVALTEERKPAPVAEAPAAGSVNIAPLLKRAFMFLEDGDWKSANEYCEKVLDQDPENAQAYLGKLMAECHVRQMDGLKDCANPFDQSGNYQKALRFADEDLKETLTGYIAHINIRNEKARLKGIYDRAKSIMLSSNSEKSYDEAAEQFEYISHYEDSAALAADCRAKAEVARKDAVLSTAVGKLVRDTISDYQTAIALLQSIPGWRDADEKLAIAQEKLTKLEAHHMELERQAALKRQQTHAAALRNRKIILFIFVSTLVLSLSIFLALKIITPAYRYSTAVKLMEEGKYSEAHSIFSSLGEYRDCLSKIEELEPLQLMETLNNAQVGEYVYFGTYEQDNDFSNGAENIEWLVLDKKDDKILVISKYALCFQQYNTTTPAEAATWETCSLRRWLNRSFITDAFNYSERAAIPTVAVPAHNNATYNTDPGNDTLDQVFLLSSIEVQQYLGNGQQAQCTPTRYSLYSNSLPAQSYCTWWLRSPGSAPLSAAIVSTSGGIIDNGTVNRTDNIAVRPAMWIDPAKLSA